ncbi:hypothetical protein LOK49_Contig720G00001 [Camellia lanceoleosa]|nr:hypothetical protein LOK49_Contig720G00001 [Camellia lanceoleosa]
MDQPEQTQHQLPGCGSCSRFRSNGSMLSTPTILHQWWSGSSTVAVHSPTEPPAPLFYFSAPACSIIEASRTPTTNSSSSNNSNFKYILDQPNARN